MSWSGEVISKLDRIAADVSRLLSSVESGSGGGVDPSPPPPPPDDGGSGGSTILLSPSDSLAEAMLDVAVGGTVALQPGLYEAPIVFQKSCRVEGRGGDRNGVVVRPSGNVQGVAFVGRAVRDCQLAGLTVDGGSCEFNGIHVSWHGSDPEAEMARDILVENCVVRDTNSNGILVTGPDTSVTVRNTLFDSCGRKSGFNPHGAYIAASGVWLDFCEITNSKGAGFQMWKETPATQFGRLHSCKVTNTDVHENGRGRRLAGGIVARGDGLRVESCRFWLNNVQGVQVGYSARDAVVRFNTFYRGDDLLLVDQLARDTTDTSANTFLNFDRP